MFLQRRRYENWGISPEYMPLSKEIFSHVMCLDMRLDQSHTSEKNARL